MAMEDNKGKKRSREVSDDSESEVNSVPNLKIARNDSPYTEPESDSPEATHVEPDPDDGDVRLPEAKLNQEDLLDILDDSDTVIGPDPSIQGLDSVIKSFEEEILVPAQAPLPRTEPDSGESRPGLGFLLEASDDELGLPPSVSSVNVEEGADVGSGSGAVGFEEIMGHEFLHPSYESFELGIGDDSDTNYNNRGDFVALGGLFEPEADISELTWQPESISAL